MKKKIKQKEKIMKISKNILKNIIKEEIAALSEGNKAVMSFITPETGGHETKIEFLGTKTDYDQTQVMLRLDGEEPPETYTAYDIDDLADQIISDLKENYDGYWFLDESSYVENFKVNLLKVLEAIGADPSSAEGERGSYRDRDTGGLY
tara:strand:- start:65 stop:511 length:447 start_codon:yes stop_codon:yes gene_type:complete